MARVSSTIRSGLCLLVTTAVLLGFALAGAQAADDDCKRPTNGTVHTPKTITFETSSTAIAPEYQAELTEIAKRFAGNPNIQLCVIGMTDRTGNAEDNKKLAKERAETVASFLKSAGLKDNTYQIRWRGQPFSDDSWVGKLLGDKPNKSDRRVEVLVMER